MTTRIIETPGDIASIHKFVDAQALPFTIQITKGKARKRTLEQNRLQRLWINEIAEQLPQDTAEGWRGYCKLHFGVPIMRNENEHFCEVYDRLIRPHSYADKIEFMKIPMDFPVTRLFTTKQHAAYLDAIHKHFTEQGVILINPESER